MIQHRVYLFPRRFSDELPLAIAAVDEHAARLAAPVIAESLIPERRWGPVLHVERLSEGRWEVVLQDLGPRT